MSGSVTIPNSSWKSPRSCSTRAWSRNASPIGLTLSYAAFA